MSGKYLSLFLLLSSVLFYEDIITRLLANFVNELVIEVS